METFNYKVLKETEKAIYVEVPYYEQTSEFKKSHKQLYYECWIPKSVISQGGAKNFVIGKRNELRLTNRHQKHCSMPSSWNTMGEYAPVKTKYTVEIIDEDKLKEMVKFYENKYGACLRRLIQDGEGSNGYVSDEDEKIINNLEFPSIKKPFIPKKQETRYK